MSERERGSVTLEAVLVYPVTLLLVLLAIHTALWFHARNLALAAAQEGLRAARVHGGSLSDGKATAERFIRQAGGSFLTSAKIGVERSADTVVVRVSGQAVGLIPLVSPAVEQVARAPAERWTAG